MLCRELRRSDFSAWAPARRCRLCSGRGHRRRFVGSLLSVSPVLLRLRTAKEISLGHVKAQFRADVSLSLCFDTFGDGGDIQFMDHVQQSANACSMWSRRVFHSSDKRDIKLQVPRWHLKQLNQASLSGAKVIVRQFDVQILQQCRQFCQIPDRGDGRFVNFQNDG